jgi:CcmD family protein
MGKFNKIVFTLVAFLIANVGFAQDVEMADTMRSNGKIYVVVGIILIILIGLIIYLFSMDRKLSKLEKELDNHQ